MNYVKPLTERDIEIAERACKILNNYHKVRGKPIKAYVNDDGVICSILSLEKDNVRSKRKTKLHVRQ